MSHHIVDLSYPLAPNTPVYPDYPPVTLTVLDSTERQEPNGPRHLNSGHLAIGLHCGTHMDAPFHFFGQGDTIERIPPEKCLGPAVRIRIPDCAAGTEITAQHLIAHQAALRETGKVVLQTGWDSHWGQTDYFTAHPVLTGEAAEFLVASGVHLVGVDFPSVDQPPHPAHLVLLGNGVLIVENLTNLSSLISDRFILIALPLRIVGRDGSPVRAIAQEPPVENLS